MRPDDPAGRVVGDEGDVLVVLPVRQFVDADLGQSVEAIARETSRDDALHDAPDGRPGHSHQGRDDRLRRCLREEGHRVLEGLGEPTARRGPRHELGRDATSRAFDASRRVPQVQLHPAQVEMPPESSLSRVVALPDTACAPAAPRDPRGRPNVANNPVGDELDALDECGLDANDLLEQCGDAHGLLGVLGWRGNRPDTPGAVRALPTPPATRSALVVPADPPLLNGHPAPLTRPSNLTESQNKLVRALRALPPLTAQCRLLARFYGNLTATRRRRIREYSSCMRISKRVQRSRSAPTRRHAPWPPRGSVALAETRRSASNDTRRPCRDVR